MNVPKNSPSSYKPSFEKLLGKKLATGVRLVVFSLLLIQAQGCAVHQKKMLFDGQEVSSNFTIGTGKHTLEIGESRLNFEVFAEKDDKGKLHCGAYRARRSRNILVGESSDGTLTAKTRAGKIITVKPCLKDEKCSAVVVINEDTDLDSACSSVGQ
jgi:hypothetical protein